MPVDVPGKGAASGVGSFLTKKVGPLPLWSYAAIVGGALLVFRMTRNPSASGGVAVVAGPASAASPGLPSGTGADLTAPAVTGPRQAPPPQDTMHPVEALVAPTTRAEAPVVSTTVSPRPPLPGPRELTPTAPVQPPVGFPANAKLATVGGTTYSLSNEAVARGDFGKPTVGPMVQPTGPSVPSAPVQPPVQQRDPAAIFRAAGVQPGTTYEYLGKTYTL